MPRKPSVLDKTWFDADDDDREFDNADFEE